MGHSHSLLRALIATSGRALVRANAIAWAGAALALVIIFAPHGMTTRELVSLFHSEPAVRIVLFGMWTAASLPGVRAMFDAPGTKMIRAAGASRANVTLVLATFAILTQWLLSAVIVKGGGFLEGVAFAIACAAASTSLVAAKHSRACAALFIATSSSIVFDLHPLLRIAISGASLGACVKVAWSRAYERPAFINLPLARLAPVLALAVAHLLRLARKERVRVGIAALFAALAGVATRLSFDGDPPSSPRRRLFQIFALPLAFAASVLARPLVDAERVLAPTWRSLGISRWIVAAGAAIAISLPASALASSGALIVAHTSAALVSSSGTWGAAIAVTVMMFARAHARTKRHEPTMFVLGVVVIGAIAILIGGLF